MKKASLFIAIIITSSMFISSCKKECDKRDQATHQVINVTINENSTFTYTIPTSPQNDNYSIAEQASHYLTSMIDPTMSPSGMIYSYTPALNYVGSDEVVLSTSNPQHGGGCQGNQNGNGNGNCNHQCNHHGGDDNSTITIIINVQKVITTSYKTLHGSHWIGCPAF